MGYHCGWSHVHHVQSSHSSSHTYRHTLTHPTQPQPASGIESEMTGRGHEVKKGEKPGRIDEVTLGTSVIFRELSDHFSSSSFFVSVLTEKKTGKSNTAIAPRCYLLPVPSISHPHDNR